MRAFTAVVAPHIYKHFTARKPYLEMLMDLGTNAEEWFRIELLAVLWSISGIVIVGTNQQTQEAKDRPDFTLNQSGDQLLVELKVLPQDRNYLYGWQRFQAGANNRKDFSNVVAGTRGGVIYIHWSDPRDWKACRSKLEFGFQVECLREDHVPCGSGSVIVSYWAAKRRDA